MENETRTIPAKECTFLTVLIVLSALSLVLQPVMAQNMSMIDVGYGQRQDLLVYSGGVLQGQYNTSSPLIELPEGDFQMLIQPSSTNVMEDPTTFMSGAYAYIEANLFPLIGAMFIVGLVFGRIL